MLAFYGFQRADDGVELASTFADRARNWLNPHNHNHLRITRILGSLNLLAQPHLSRAFYAALEALKENPNVTGETWGYWRRAAHV